jgi:hypothetical protein
MVPPLPKYVACQCKTVARTPTILHRASLPTNCQLGLLSLVTFDHNYPAACQRLLPVEIRVMGHTVLQTHINFPRFLPIFPDFLERLSH